MLIYDSSKQTTVQKPLSKVYIEVAQQKAMWWSLIIYSGLITAEKIRGLSCYFGVIIVLRVFPQSFIQWDFLRHFNVLGEVVSWRWLSVWGSYQSFTLRRLLFENLVMPSEFLSREILSLTSVLHLSVSFVDFSKISGENRSLGWSHMSCKIPIKICSKHLQLQEPQKLW